ncbi:PREDICTED: protein S-acyltransferase 10-like isoform X2 [Brassica oleracea var. oleracea]|nr:PREDICTED: protein S-acyltransferase 10-like isoform X2 [Brassica oleracea var. oleracea]
MSSYFFLFSVTLLQYFVTCGSSPRYVIDAMRDVDETNAILYRYAPTTSFKNCLRCQKMVLDLYPPGTSLRWYICEESALCIWTLIMYIDYLTNVAKPWWKNAVIILLLVVLVISLIFVLLLLLFHS